MKFKITITGTLLIGGAALFISIFKLYDLGAVLGAILVLGRASFPEIVNIIKAWKGTPQ